MPLHLQITKNKTQNLQGSTPGKHFYLISAHASSISKFSAKLGFLPAKYIVTQGAFTPDLFGLVKTSSGLLAQLVHFVWAGLKAGNRTLVGTKNPD